MPLRGRGTRRRDAARGAPRDRERLLLHAGSRRRDALFVELEPAPLRRAPPQPDRAPVRADRRRPRPRVLTPDYLERLGAGPGTPRPRSRRRHVVAQPERPRRSSSSPTSPRSSGSTRASRSTPAGSASSPATTSRRRRSSASRSSAIGLFYRRGYFRQRLDEHDRQVERYPRNDTSRLPLELVPMAPVVELADDNGDLVPVRLGVWRAQVGRVSLYLLDTKIEGNPDWARDVTDILYGGDRENRLRQELVLGVGGVRVLRRLGLDADGLPPERGPLGVPPARADARARRGAGAVGRRRARAAARARPCSRRTRRCRPGTRCSTRSSCERNLGGLVERCGLTWDEFARARQGRGERQGLRAHAVRAPHVGVRERRRRSCTAPSRARCGTGSGPSSASTKCRSRRSRTASTSGRGSLAELEVLLGDTDPQFELRAGAAGRGSVGRAPRREGAAARVRRPRRAARASSTRTSSRSASPAASRPTSARACSSAGPTGSRGSSPIPSGRSRCSWPARRTRPTRTGRT